MAKTTKIEIADVKMSELEQIEHSAKIACDFMHDELLPILDKFETETTEIGYIHGMVTHCLFAELVQRMSELGYTEKDLRKEIKLYLNTSMGQVIH